MPDTPTVADALDKEMVQDGALGLGQQPVRPQNAAQSSLDTIKAQVDANALQVKQTVAAIQSAIEAEMKKMEGMSDPTHKKYIAGARSTLAFVHGHLALLCREDINV